MSRTSYIDIARGKLEAIIQHRSNGYSAYEVAHRLGLMAWEVYALTQFIRVCVTTDEKRYFEEEAEARGFGTVGEFLMDIVNRCYEAGWYDKALKADREPKGRKKKRAA